MAPESKQIDGVVDDPENGNLKSGPCLIAGFHALSCTSPSYYNPYRGCNKNTLSVDMVRLSLTFKGDRGEWLSRKGAQLTDCDELDEIAKLEDPRSRGKALTGNLAGVWRYRVGDYRILCDINDGRLVILVVDVAHRREVYKRR